MKQSSKAILLTMFSLSLAGAASAADVTTSSRSTGSSASAQQSGAATQRSAGEERQWERQHRASKIIGTDVYDLQGRKVGEVRDVVIQPGRGEIEYAVVSFGGVMGVGSKYFAVPWKSLQASSDANRYMLNVDKDALKSAPSFDRSRWPDMANQQWRNDVERFWQNRSGNTSTGNSEAGRSSSEK